MPQAAQIRVNRFRMASGQGRRFRRRRRAQRLRKRRGNLARDLVLHGEDVGRRLAVMIAPQSRLITRLDQAHVDPHGIASPLHGTSDDESDPQGTRDFTDTRPVPVCEGGVRGDHPQATDFPQLRRHRFGYAIGEVAVTLTDRREWEYGD